MSYSISTLLTRNLHDVFGENDPARRRAAVDEIFTEDCVFYDPSRSVYGGGDEIDRIAGAIRATHPDFRYQPIAEPEELGNGGRIKWVSGRPGDAPDYAGTDFIITRDGQISALYLFLTRYPELWANGSAPNMTAPSETNAPCANGPDLRDLGTPRLLYREKIFVVFLKEEGQIRTRDCPTVPSLPAAIRQ
jgi:hypothetical protein